MKPLFIKVWYHIPNNRIRDFVVVRNTGQTRDAILANAREKLRLMGWADPKNVRLEEN